MSLDYEERIARLDTYFCPNCGEPAVWFNLAEAGEAYCKDHTPKTFGNWCKKEALITWLRSQGARDAGTKGSRGRGGSG